MTQLLAVQFTPGGRQYTYHNDGDPVGLDDRVVVMTNRGPQTVRVVSLKPQRPKVPTKAIVGKADRPAQPTAQQGRLL